MTARFLRQRVLRNTFRHYRSFRGRFRFWARVSRSAPLVAVVGVAVPIVSVRFSFSIILVLVVSVSVVAGYATTHTRGYLLIRSMKYPHSRRAGETSAR